MRKQRVSFCTYFDKNYLVKGLSMIESLRKNYNNAPIWVLCFDKYTEKTIIELKLKNVSIISLKDFEDKKLKKVKTKRSTVEYYWTCTPSLPLYILKNDPQSDLIIYCDADLFFYSSLIPVFKEFGNGSIYSVESRYPSHQQFRNHTTGKFNVGFQIFRNNKEGVKCLKRWREQCLEWCYWKEEDGKLADQMYLNEWPSLYTNLVISRNLGVNAAPWNINQYKVEQKHSDVYIDNDKLIFFHFHQFNLLSSEKFEFSRGYHLSKEVKKLIYNQYVTNLKKQILSIQKIDPSFDIRTNHLLWRLIKGSIINLAANFYWELNARIKLQ